jgi:hypothetical protein
VPFFLLEKYNSIFFTGGGGEGWSEGGMDNSPDIIGFVTFKDFI